jgi:hypothetical protein
MKTNKKDRLLALVSAVVTELDASALVSRKVLIDRVRANVDVNAEDLRDALTTRLRLCDLARELNHTEAPVLTEQAYLLAQSLVNHCPTAAVFLDDLAEWLILPLQVRRSLTASAFGDTQAAA